MQGKQVGRQWQQERHTKEQQARLFQSNKAVYVCLFYIMWLRWKNMKFQLQKKQVGSSI